MAGRLSGTLQYATSAISTASQLRQPNHSRRRNCRNPAKTESIWLSPTASTSEPSGLETLGSFSLNAIALLDDIGARIETRHNSTDAGFAFTTNSPPQFNSTTRPSCRPMGYAPSQFEQYLKLCSEPDVLENFQQRGHFIIPQ